SRRHRALRRHRRPRSRGARRGGNRCAQRRLVGALPRRPALRRAPPRRPPRRRPSPRGGDVMSIQLAKAPAALADQLAPRFGAHADVDPVPSPYTTGSPIHDVFVRHADGTHEHWVAKDLAFDSLIEPALAVKDRRRHDRRREPAVYALLEGFDLGLAGWKA